MAGNKKPKFQRGQQVQLKSGGPAMTINSILFRPSGDFGESEGEFTGRYFCVWFSKAQSHYFDEESLKPVKSDDET